MADVGDKIAPHLHQLMGVGNVLEGHQHAVTAGQVHRPHRNPKRRVLPPVVAEEFRRARRAVPQAILDRIEQLRLAQRGQEMPPRDPGAQQR